MGTIYAATLCNKAATLIQDITGVRWAPAELAGYLSDGQREVVLLKPEACVKNVSSVLVAGSTKQAIPADGISLIRVTRNMGAAGTTPGNAIRIINREILDAQIPTWHSDAAIGSIKHYVYDPLDPKTFYCNPQAPATAWYVEQVYSASPADVTVTNTGGTSTGTTPISIDDVYANALIDYILYRAYSKDAEYAANGVLAMAHYTAFQNSVSGKTNADLARNPNRTDGGSNPNVPK